MLARYFKSRDVILDETQMTMIYWNMENNSEKTQFEVESPYFNMDCVEGFDDASHNECKPSKSHIRRLECVNLYSSY